MQSAPQTRMRLMLLAAAIVVAAAPLTAIAADAAFIVGSTSLGDGDVAVNAALVGLGYTVTLVDDDVATAADANGMAVVVISASVNGNVLLGTFRDVTVPVVTWEKDIYDDMDLTTDQNVVRKQTQIDIVDSGHAMAAGLSGTVTVYTRNEYITWGAPTVNADVVATVAGDAAKATIFGYETAAIMANGFAAPSRRVGMFMDADSAESWTADGQDLFEAAVTWAANAGPPANQPPVADAGPDQNVTDTDEGGDEDVTLDGSGSYDNDGTIVSYEWEEATVPIASGVSPLVTLSVAVHTIDLIVTDDDTDTGTDSVVITVNPGGNIPPTADAGPDQNVTDTDENGSEDVTLDGSASDDPDGTIVSYEWEEASVPIASGVSPLVTLDVNVHTIDLTVTDDDTDTDTDSVIIAVSAPSNNEVLFVAGTATLGAADQVVADLLTTMGYTVTVMDDAVATAGDAAGKVLVVLSATINGNVVLGTFRTVAVPVVTWEKDIYDDMDMTTAQGVEIKQRDVDIVDSGHAMAAGLSGTVTVYTDKEYVTWGAVTAGADAVATVEGDSSKATLFGYEIAAVMANGYAAPARRVGVFLDANSAEVLTTDGTSLIDAALSWATAPPPNQAPIADAGPDQNVTDNDDNGSEDVTLDGSGSDDVDGTIVSYEWEESSVPIASGVSPLVTLSVAVHTIDLIVTDDDTTTDSNSVVVTVNPYVNQPPTADAGPDQNVTDTDEGGDEDVTLDGSGSNDADGTIVSYEWEEASVPIASGVGPVVTLDVAVHTIDLTVTDDDTATDSDTVIITVSAPGSGTGPVVADISAGFNMDAFCGPKEFQECRTAVLDLVDLFGDLPQGNGRFIFEQNTHMIGNSTGEAMAYSVPGDAGHPVNYGGTQGVPIDGVLTGGDGRTYHMGSAGGNSTLAGDWTEVADPSTYVNKPNCIHVGSAHNTADFQVASVTVELPAGQKGQYLNVNFVLAAANVADKARNMRIVALYGDGTDTEVLYSFSTADGGDGPLMTDTDGGATFSAVYTMSKAYARSTGATGAVADITGRLWEFTTPIGLDPAKTLWGFRFEDVDPALNWNARGLTIFAATVSDGSAPNVPPTADAGPDQAVEDTDENGSEDVTLDGSGSSDSDGTIVSYEWEEASVPIGSGVGPTLSFTVAAHTVDLIVIDDDTATDSDSVLITVTDPAVNTPPTADAGPDQNVEDTDENGSEDVTLDGSGSFDIDGTIVSYEWEEATVPIASGVGPTVSFTVGGHTVDLIVTDDDTDTGTDSVLITVDPPVQTGVYYVDQSHPSASDGNPGTPTLPWLTIDHAVSSMTAGETTYVKAGIYREYIKMVTSGTSGDPITLAAFGSDRVVISGASEINGWAQCDSAAARGNPDYASIYYADIAWRPAALYQDNVPLTPGRHPEIGWWLVESSTNGSITDSVNLTQPDDYWNGGEMFIWRVSATQMKLANITDFDQSSNTLDYDYLDYTPAVNDRYFLRNKVELINDPGEYAVEDMGGGVYRVYAWAYGGGDPDSYLMEAPDPGITTRHLVELHRQSYWVVDGFEIRHNSGHGIGSYTAETPTAGYNTVQNCSIHHNEGSGVYERYTVGNTYCRNYVAYNGALGGIGISLIPPTSDILIEECEIAFNSKDGIKIHDDNITIRRCYVHGQWFYQHADNLQTSNYAGNILVEDCFVWNSGQSYMSDGMAGLTFINNVIGGARAYPIIFSGDDLTLDSNTIAFSGYGAINTNVDEPSTDGFIFSDNIMMSGHAYQLFAMTSSNTFTSDYNLFYFAEGISDMDSVVVLWDSEFTARGMVEYQTDSGEDQNSLFAAPQFVNAPASCPSVDRARQVEFTPTRVYMQAAELALFNVGDNIEIDWDGTMRSVTAIGADYLDFSPAEDRVAFKCQVIANWKTATDTTLDMTPDTGSAAIGNGSGGGNIGSSIDTVQFGIGDFTGDDVRDIPDWPEDPNP